MPEEDEGSRRSPRAAERFSDASEFDFVLDLESSFDLAFESLPLPLAILIRYFWMYGEGEQDRNSISTSRSPSPSHSSPVSLSISVALLCKDQELFRDRVKKGQINDIQ